MPCKYANIIVTPAKLEFEVDEGWKFIPPYQYIRIAKDGPGIPPHFSISIDEDWLSISPYAGEAPRNVRVGCDSPGMKAEVYRAHVRVVSADFSQVVEVVLTILPKLIADPAPVIPEPTPTFAGDFTDVDMDIGRIEYTPVPPEYEFPKEPEPTYQPEPESWFTVLIRWILKLLRG